MADELYDPYAKPAKKPSSAGIPALLDPADREDPDRPVRTEDLIPRHGRTGWPKLWLPDGSGMDYYFRPSGWGSDADNSERLAAWLVRKTVEGYLDTGQQGLALRLERSVLPPPDEAKGQHDAVNQKAKNLVFDADRLGTAKHSMTEKLDQGIPFNVLEEFEYVLEAWVNMTRHLRIVDLPTGVPGVECFVAMDQPRRDQYGRIMLDAFGNPIMVRGAGTFDRLMRYLPCEVCGKSNYIVDLKTSGATGFRYAMRKSGIQLGIYSVSDLYIPWPDGKGADRVPLPDVCLHKGILVSIPPAGDGEPSIHWLNIERGLYKALYLIPEIKDHQKETDWMVEFTPVPSLRNEIDKATTPLAVRELFHQYPGDHWNGELALYASNRIKQIESKAIEGEVI